MRVSWLVVASSMVAFVGCMPAEIGSAKDGGADSGHPTGKDAGEVIVDPCQNVSCSGHGTCSSPLGVAECACTGAFHPSGSDCVSDANPCDGVTCSNVGTCAVNGPDAVCTCPAGYTSNGTTCTKNVEQPEGLIIPGRIEAEDYDQGGEGVGYHDTTQGNSGNTYRTDDVDIQDDGNGARSIGWTVAGEWLAYTVTVAKADTYTLNLRVSSPGTDGRVHLEVDGNNVSDTMNVPNTGGFPTFQLISKQGIALTAGKHVIKVVVDVAHFNFDAFLFSSASSTAVCGDGVKQEGEACDGEPCCTGQCTFAPATKTCRAAAGTCDVAEQCSGTSATCGTDLKVADGTSCNGGTCNAGVCAGANTSAGCGKTGAQTGLRTVNVNVSGTARSYLLYVPPGYNATRPLPIVWVFHYMDGNGSGFRNDFNFDAVSGNDAIVLYPNGLPQYHPEVGVNGQKGWEWNADNNNDLAMFDQVTASLENDYCVNPNRVFSTGFSYGGHHNFTLACYRGNAVRAVAPIAGKMFGDTSRCTQQTTSIMAMTGKQDYQSESFNNFLFHEKRMGCSSTTTPISNLPCVEYPSCSMNQRAIWCGNYNEGHTIPQTWSSIPAIWSFFQSFQ